MGNFFRFCPACPIQSSPSTYFNYHSVQIHHARQEGVSDKHGAHLNFIGVSMRAVNAETVVRKKLVALIHKKQVDFHKFYT